jgi:DNA-directed RNA polymerase subunit E'/Rpb7
MFRLKDKNFITNEMGKVIAVDKGKDIEQANIIMEDKNGKIHQRFRVVYVDEYEEEPTKGQLNKKFGLFVERDFFVVSALPGGRYLDLINNRNMVQKVRNGRRTQLWYFHQQSLTIKTRLNNQSWDIKSSGKTNDMQIWSTNSGWF